MQTYDVLREDGKLLAFEISNAYVTPRKVATILDGIDGVTEVRLRKLFRPSNEVHIRFRFDSRECVVWEPYGDNSRYWIGPENVEGDYLDVNELKTYFEHYRPPLVARVIGDLLSLNLKSWLRAK